MSIVGFRNFGGGTVTRRAFFALSAVGRSAAGISLALLVAALAGNHAYGADCPDNKTARKGFVLERPGVRTVVRLTAEQVAIVNNEFASASPQTQFLAGGLIEVFRTSSKGAVCCTSNVGFPRHLSAQTGQGTRDQVALARCKEK